MMFQRLILGLTAAAVFSAQALAATVIVVRHAERADSGMAAGGMSTDPPLSAAGEARAKELARVLKDAGVTRIFTTELQRTKQTAAPLAELAGVKPSVIPAKDTDGLVKALKRARADDVVLVVGHSNTVPVIVQQLSGTAQPAMAETEYDRLTIVNTAGKPVVLVLRFGADVK